LLASFVVLAVVGVAAGQSVTVTLESSQSGQSVAAGTTIDWTIKVVVSTGDNVGLAAVVADVVQDPNNPERFDIPPADPNSLDATMLQFSRPAGLSNPGETDPTSGYTGVQRGEMGMKDLLQVGGAQNTFGQAGTLMGHDFNVASGVGQSGAQIVASGSFPAPATSGTYVFRLANVMANVLESVATPPAHSPVVAATVDATGGEFSFTVGPSVCRGDANCDGEISFGDINGFVDAIVKDIYCDGTGDNSDLDENGSVGFEDINPFVDLLTKNTLPIPCP
jgi:hypothetical protein